MKKKNGNECSNKNKDLYSRPAIVAMINDYFGDESITMFDLLGSGVGADYYLEHLNLSHLTLVERNFKKHREYLDRMKSFRFDFKEYSKDWEKFPLLKVKNTWISPRRIQLNKFFETNLTEYDVVNLDFCSFLYDNGNDNCTAYLVDNMFKNNVVADGGLVLFTFMTKGLGVYMHKSMAITEQTDIMFMLEEIAARHGYEIEEMHTYFYQASKPTYMINIGVKVTKI